MAATKISTEPCRHCLPANGNAAIADPPSFEYRIGRIRLRMISRAVNGAYRLVLKLAYPVLDTFERTLGIRSNVAMVAVWHADKLLMIRHSYRDGEGLPGGMIGAGESPAEAAARELHEEVGVFARPDDLIFVRSWRQWQTHTWLFEYRPLTQPRINPDQREVVSGRFVEATRIPRSIQRMVAKCRFGAAK